jgi:hypothetical protein
LLVKFDATFVIGLVFTTVLQGDVAQVTCCAGDFASNIDLIQSIFLSAINC